MKMIFDPIRNKEVAATPEEVVRQKVIQWLLKGLEVPKEWIQSEVKIKGNWAADLLVQATVDGKVENILLIETKAPSVDIDGYVFAQAERYMQILKPKYVCMTNGKEFYYFKKIGGKYDTCDTLPHWKELCSS
jgi:hypothetical protein